MKKLPKGKDFIAKKVVMLKPKKHRPKPTLNKKQEKRFDERFDPQDEELDKVLAYSIDSEDAKQHLAKELSLQKKEIIEKLPALWAEHRAEVSHAMEYGTKKDIPNFFQWVKTKL